MSSKFEVTVSNLLELQQLAKKLLPHLPRGEIIGLHGELGAGKTEFVRAIAECLGIVSEVQSPTYVLEAVYQVPKGFEVEEISHWDCYRLSSSNQVEELGMLEYLGRRDVLLLVEWPSRVEALKRLLSLEITLFFGAFEQERRIVFQAERALINELRAVFS